MGRRKHTAWKKLKRDKKGRWLPSTEKPKKEEKKKLKHSKKELATEDVEQVLEQVGKKFQESCPRCAGEMENHWIRCGPNKVVEVRKCQICNFWLPISE